MIRTSLRCALTSGVLVAAGCAQAADITFNGFADFTAGEVVGGSNQSSYLQYKCPCFISNYEYGGIYQNTGVSVAKESMIGLQANAKIDDKLTAVLQVDSRGLNGYQPSVDWAYASYALTDTFTVQVGRKRLPWYMYSDYNYVGYAYIWVRPPVDLYGWEVYSYDGVNLQYNNAWGDWALYSNTWAGNQSSTNVPGLSQVYNGYPTDTAWRDIIGTSVDLSNEYMHFRAMYMQNKIYQGAQNPGNPATQTAATPDTPLQSAQLQQVWGLAWNIDYKNFVMRSEYNSVLRPQMGYVANSYLAGGGYRIGDFTGMYTYSQYRESKSWLYTSPQRDSTRAVTVRWDFRPSMALKLQYDMFVDHSQTVFLGDSKLVTAGFDMVF